MPQLSLSEFADKISQLLPEVMKEFARRQVGELYRGKISLQQLLAMTFLEHYPESKMSDLAVFLKVTTAAVTGMVDRLVKLGYVSRLFDERDRRLIKVKLTSRGSMFIKKIKQQRRQMIFEIFGKLSQEDRENYLKIISRVHELITAGKII